jgi:hypothetical protein
MSAQRDFSKFRRLTEDIRGRRYRVGLVGHIIPIGFIRPMFSI